MSKRLIWAAVPFGFALVLAASSMNCGGSGPVVQCAEDADCNGRAWEIDTCTEDEGHWECLNNGCSPRCGDDCQSNHECFTEEWTQACSGHYDCAHGRCDQVCDSDNCGDGICSAYQGESDASCPVDCNPACRSAEDCTSGYDWAQPCEGRWDCQSESCVEVCDYDACGDGTCDGEQGENDQSCFTDCVDGCRGPTECYSESWAPGAICQGRWSCFQTECQRVCDDANCGDGVCLGLNGENEESCFRDCLGGPCEARIDCMGQRWYEPDHVACQGHWECVQPSEPKQLSTGACEAVCADGPGESCGDGSCDTLNGETPTSCVVDCGSGYACTKNEDCGALPLPSGCTGSWICASRICVPQCE